VQVTVVQVIDVAFVLDARVTAVLTVNVGVVVVNLVRHGRLPRKVVTRSSASQSVF
jgi:hypothetical protein